MTSASLPPLYAAWVRDLLPAPIPAEENATCDACAMVPAPGEGGEDSYNPDTKCCTFVPEIWNFLVGGVLLDEHDDAAPGRATVEARIDRGIGVTPRGLHRSSTYDLLYASSPLSFGHSATMRCPHYLDADGGRCGVWRHRESTCTTWFCKHVRGQVGRDFWTHLHQLLHAAEEAVSAWCLMELGVDGSALATLYEPYARRKRPRITAHDMDDVPDMARLQAAWGSWRGREREFYRECARLAASLSWADVTRIAGPELAIFSRLVQAAHARVMDDAPPAHPITALVQITPRGSLASRLGTYSAGDKLDVPPVVAAMLPLFDGRPLADALAEIERRHGVVVDPSLVRKLSDFGILRDARAPSVAVVPRDTTTTELF